MTYIITKEDEAITIKQFISKHTRITQKQLTRLKKLDNGILLNEQRVTVRATLKENDVLTLNTEIETKTSDKIKPIDLPMSIIYEDEQQEKKALAERLHAELDKDKEQNDGIEKFIAKVKAITDIQELTPEIVREFISRIDVYAPYRENKQRHQRIDIYYHGVGYVFIPEPEEVEEMFQEHLRDRKQYMKEKTA